jgi:hypothetical protein
MLFGLTSPVHPQRHGGGRGRAGGGGGGSCLFTWEHQGLLTLEPEADRTSKVQFPVMYFHQ